MAFTQQDLAAIEQAVSRGVHNASSAIARSTAQLEFRIYALEERIVARLIELEDELEATRRRSLVPENLPV